jgi:hypothetical protein
MFCGLQNEQKKPSLFVRNTQKYVITVIILTEFYNSTI